MISKKISCKPGNDNYRRLANYVAAASDKRGEKLLYRWHEGCEADDYDLAIKEVEAVQAMNVRTRKEKTYHLLVSFRPQDEDKLSQEVLQDIEQRFARALGFTEHQRHCGVHRNTNNLHLHVAYNMIHPQKLTRLEPWRDYKKRDQVCRQIERDLGLVIDVEKDLAAEKIQPTRGNDKARTVEAHTGQQSFDGYCKEHRDQLIGALVSARSWQDLHRELARVGIELRVRGNGCVLQDRHGKYMIKASSVARDFSKGALEKRLGPFVQAAVEAAQEQEHYQARPLHRAPERGGLFKEYMSGIARRREVLDVVKREQAARSQAARSQWAAKRREFQNKPGLTRRDRQTLLIQADRAERTAVETIRSQANAQREALRQEVPYTSWASFLKLKAEAGSELALAILRSRQKEVAPEASRSEAPSPWQERQDAWQARMATRENWRAKQAEIKQNKRLLWQDKQPLLAVAKMKQLEAEEVNGGQRENIFRGVTYKVDAKGTILFHLASGGLLKDNGNELFFSAWDAKARDAALTFARCKYGRSFMVEGNRIARPAPARQMGRW